MPALPSEANDELGFDWATNGDQIRGMAVKLTWEAVAWRYTQQTDSWIRVEYREEVFMSRGDWYEGRFLGSIEIQGGEISVINRFWDKLRQ